jgi:hypothetical protein
MGSVVVSVVRTQFSRLGGPNSHFWLQVPNSLVNSLTLIFGARVVTRGWRL